LPSEDGVHIKSLPNFESHFLGELGLTEDSLRTPNDTPENGGVVWDTQLHQCYALDSVRTFLRLSMTIQPVSKRTVTIAAAIPLVKVEGQ